MSRYPQFDREQLFLAPIAERQSDVGTERVARLQHSKACTAKVEIGLVSAAIRQAKHAGRPVVLMIGGHPIKLGLSPFLIDLIENGFVTGLATNGAGLIHDFELAITRLNGYLTLPGQIKLLPDAAACIRKLRERGFQCVLVTNQSAVGRGLISADQLEEIHQELKCQLAVEGAELDAIYSCHEVPLAHDETIVEHPDRKPGPGMLLRAARDLKLNLMASWMIGDRLSDVLAGVNAGCRSIRVRSGHRYVCPIRSIGCNYVSKYSIKEAAEFILAESEIQREFQAQHR